MTKNQSQQFISHMRLSDLQEIHRTRLTLIRDQLSQIAHSCTPNSSASSKLPILIDGPLSGSYSLAIVNRELGKALAASGVEVGLDISPTEAARPSPLDMDSTCWQLFEAGQRLRRGPHLLLRTTYPPVTHLATGALNIYHSYAWEESELPVTVVDSFNRDLNLITTNSHFTRDVLVANGVSVPIVTTGLGIDHVGHCIDPRRTDSPDAARRPFTFLHLSSCFPRKGLDILLEAYASAFTSSHNVLLVIKTFPNPHNNCDTQIQALQKAHPGCAPIALINEDWADTSRIAALYARCDVVVGPSRGEGFGMPFAEALWRGRPVIVTGHGGHLDFLGRDYPWLIDYEFRQSHSHVAGSDSFWSEPSTRHLTNLLRNAYNSTKEERDNIVLRYQNILRAKHTWRTVATLVRQAIDSSHDLAQRKRRIQECARGASVTSWGSPCGIAEYSSFLYNTDFLRRLTILADTCDAASTEDGRTLRLWTPCQSVEGLIEHLRHSTYDFLIIQYHGGFFSVTDLIRIVIACGDAYCFVVIHNVKDFADDFANADLCALSRVTFLVHTIADLNILKAKRPDILTQTMRLPHGIAISLSGTRCARSLADDNRPFSVSSFGFLLPHKGTRELLRAVKLLREEGLDVVLKLYTAVRGASSRLYYEECLTEARALFSDSALEWSTEFLPAKEVVAKLAQTNLICLPYDQTTRESASGALRLAVASGTPVVVSPSEIFSEAPACVPVFDSYLAEDIAAKIRHFVSHPQELEIVARDQRLWSEALSFTRMAKRLESVVISTLLKSEFKTEATHDDDTHTPIQRQNSNPIFLMDKSLCSNHHEISNSLFPSQ
jgi:glycosyltransferase involved in cell wall biosynthesis